eukprot:TRINITY_DN48535_c0_g1_i1.p1 TRINITY_DN48535_c0_g1~~TRINITY_DN48535_c0_g1_i1.p1  ORF type:complete len:576 (-),score=118.59 TRINITY_DN48535_c0_g1_i1:121-1848(-)
MEGARAAQRSSSAAYSLQLPIRCSSPPMAAAPEPAPAAADEIRSTESRPRRQPLVSNGTSESLLPPTAAAPEPDPAAAKDRGAMELRPQRRPPQPIGTSDLELGERAVDPVERTVADLHCRGFALAQLLKFVEDHDLRNKESLSTAEVVRDIVIPCTSSQRCAFADVMPAFSGLDVHYGLVDIPAGRKTANVFVSHCWSSTFMSTVRTILQFAAGKDSLDPFCYTKDQLSMTFWLCIFAVNQHTAICGTARNPCSCGSTKLFPPDPQCEIDKFDGIMQRVRQHVVAMDVQLEVLKRVWVLLEISVAFKLGFQSVFLGNVPEDLLAQGASCMPRVQDGEATDPADKRRILQSIKEDIGFDEFNLRVSSLVATEVQRLRVFALVRKQNFAAMMALVKSDLRLLGATDVQDDDATLLHALVKFDDAVDAVQELLALQADPNAQNGSGLTPLHVLSSARSPKLRRSIMVQTLLEAGADPDAESPTQHSAKDFGRLGLDSPVSTLQVGRMQWPNSCPSLGSVERRLLLRRGSGSSRKLSLTETPCQSSDNASEQTPGSAYTMGSHRHSPAKLHRLMFGRE